MSAFLASRLPKFTMSSGSRDSSFTFPGSHDRRALAEGDAVSSYMGVLVGFAIPAKKRLGRFVCRPARPMILVLQVFIGFGLPHDCGPRQVVPLATAAARTAVGHAAARERLDHDIWLPGSACIALEAADAWLRDATRVSG